MNCRCHDVPMRHAVAPDRRSGERWRCAVKQRGYEARHDVKRAGSLARILSETAAHRRAGEATASLLPVIRIGGSNG